LQEASSVCTVEYANALTDPRTNLWHVQQNVFTTNGVGIVHVFVDGLANVHAGDGQWFHMPGAKIGQIRSVTMDPHGNILLVENDFGYVHRIDFTRLVP
jgi:hypothetical protein